MIDFRLNKHNTKMLLKASNQCPLPNKMKKLRLDWLLEQNRLVGCLYERWPLQPVICHLVKDPEEGSYKIVSLFRNQPGAYLIEDIDTFLDFINVDELCTEDKIDTETILDNLSRCTVTGLIKIKDDKIYLYDKYEVIYEDA